MHRATCNIAIAAILAATVTACTDPRISRAHKAVAAALIDPDSAKFEDDVLTKDGHVCGFVNAKNRMGAYVGRSPYIYDDLLGPMMIREPPTTRDLQSLDLTNAKDESWSDRWQNIQLSCFFIDKWHAICEHNLGEVSPNANRLCKAWNDAKGDVRKTMRTLGVASLRYGY